MKGAKYREILDEELLQSAQDLRLGRRFPFQQDNDRKHTVKTTQDWLRDKSLNVLECPSPLLRLGLLVDVDFIYIHMACRTGQRSLICT
jgi:hypothetical protein